MKNQTRRKPAQRLFSGLAGSPLSQQQSADPAQPAASAAAIRAKQWREQQKQNTGFSIDEAKRKREERKQQRDSRMLAGWLREYPIDEKSNYFAQKNLGKVFLSGGSGIAPTGGFTGADVELIEGLQRTDIGRVAPKGHSGDTDVTDDKIEQENTFARKISFKHAHIESILIGNRNVRFYNLQNGDAVDHLSAFAKTYYDNGVCKLCGQPAADEHFELNHRREIIRYIRWYEAKAYRPKKRNCDEDHAGQIKRNGSGPTKLYCRKCNKLLYKPERSDASVAVAAAA
jgi:hypothetical protein